MSDITLGDIIGDICPFCRSDLEIEGEFHEGTEIECRDCGKWCAVGAIHATYTITMEKSDED